MADVTIDPQNNNPKELYGQGIRAFVLQDFDTAVRAFSKVSELLSAEHGSETHDSLGDVYLYYGKSLLEVSRRDSGPLGDGVLKNVEEESEEDNGESEGEVEKTEKDKGTEEGSTDNAEGDQKDKEKEDETQKTEDKKSDEDTKAAEDAKTAKDTATVGDKPGEQSTKAEEANSSTDKKEGEQIEDELTDLQVAWEVLELAKCIFRSRGTEGKKNLAETLIVLGEISLESGNFASAIEDMKEGLEIQKTLFGNDSRTIAETYFKLGGAFSTNGQIDEAIESFSSSYEYLKNKIDSLKKDEEHKEANAEEIEELTSLVPEIEEKIADMKNLKSEVAEKVSSSLDENKPSANGNAEVSSSSKPANDISHLVKRKRRDDDDNAKDENPAKKPTP